MRKIESNGAKWCIPTLFERCLELYQAIFWTWSLFFICRNFLFHCRESFENKDTKLGIL